MRCGAALSQCFDACVIEWCHTIVSTPVTAFVLAVSTARGTVCGAAAQVRVALVCA